jgi:hypothetical protein
MTLMIIIAIFSLLLILFIIKINRSIKYKITNLNDTGKYFTTLIEVCKENSLLFIKHKDTGYFIQYAKYVMKNNEINLHFGFPDAPWSRAIFSSIQNIFKNNDIKYNITDTTSNLVTRFLEVNFIANEIVAIKISKLAFKAMGLSEKDNYILYYQADLDEKAIRENLKEKIAKAKASSR